LPHIAAGDWAVSSQFLAAATFLPAMPEAASGAISTTCSYVRFIGVDLREGPRSGDRLNSSDWE
jgi:hypothetical protein